jgi:coenzyme F420-0:L-glutamate ligase/coenzyme F420-1:gamma-L-glutamate ligase
VNQSSGTSVGVQITPVHGLPEVRPGDDLARLLLDALERQGLELRERDIVVVAQKIVSKAEGRLVRLDEVEPSTFARTLAAAYGRDARLIEVVLRESRRVVRMDRGILIVETHHGFVCANAGVDLSNVAGGAVAALLPVDPDASAACLRAALFDATGLDLAVIISDTFGRPWRLGLTNIAIGIAGLDPFRSYVGRYDRAGYPLRVSVLALADEVAGAAELVMGKTEGVPVAIVRGVAYTPSEQGTARALVRPAEQDLFR